MSAEPKTEQKKKSLVKRILKWSGITFFALLVLLIALPIIFQKKIFQMVLEEANKNLTADVSIEDYELTFISTFPNLILELKEVKISGRDEFEGVDLIDATSIEAKLNLKSLFSDQVKVERISLIDANINMLVTRDGKANYDITIPDSAVVEDQEPSKFALNLKSYELKNANFNYDDATSGTKLVMTQLNHSGSGDLTQDVVDFKTNTNIEALTLISGGIPYLIGTNTEAIFNLLLETKENETRITLKENQLRLNNFTTSYDGWVAVQENFTDFDLKLDASKSTFASFLSLMPSVYRTGYESMITKGSFSLDGYIKGKMTETEVPGFLFKLLVNDAAFSYPDLPAGFKNINIDVTAKRDAGSNLDNTTVDIKKFHVDFLENTIRADMFLSSLMTDPNIKSAVKAKVDLATLEKVMPMMPGESYNGKLDADMQFAGRMSAIEQERYEDFQAAGYLKLNEFKYASADFTKPVLIHDAEMEFTPKYLALKKSNMEIGQSDLKLDGRVDNYMAYLFKPDEVLQGTFNLSSNFMELNELMGVSATPTAENTSNTKSAAAPAEEPTSLPSNLDVKLNANIGKLSYDGMKFENIRGAVGIKDAVAALNNVQMNAFGGAFGLDGTYDTRNAKQPKVDLTYNMRDVDAKALSNQFVTIEKLVPVLKHLEGRMNANFSVSSMLTSNLDFVLESLSSLGDFSMKTMKISGFEPLVKLSNELKMPQLSSQTLKDVAASFKILDGKINLAKPLNVKLDKVQINAIQGWTSLTQNINYTMQVMVPKEMIPNDVVKSIEQGLSQLGGVAQKLNIGKLPAFIPVDVTVLGTVTKPEIKTNFKESVQRLAGNLKDQFTDLATEKLNQVKDSVTQVINNKVDEVKSDLMERKQKLIDDAQKQADQVKLTAKKQADNVRSEANKRADELVAAARNPIEKAAAERTARGIREEGEKNAKKIEDEANKRADQIMKDAREKADKLQ